MAEKRITKTEAYRRRRAEESEWLEAFLRDLQRVTDATDPIGMEALYHGAKLLSYVQQWEAR